jgi:hypothetical protein
MSANLLSKEDGMKLLDFPDLQEFYNLNNAGLNNIERAIELIIDEGRYQTPEPYQNLTLGIQKMQQAYLMYQSANAPEERLELFRRWIEDAQTLLQRSQQQALQQQQADVALAEQAALAGQQAAAVGADPGAAALEAPPAMPIEGQLPPIE